MNTGVVCRGKCQTKLNQIVKMKKQLTTLEQDVLNSDNLHSLLIGNEFVYVPALLDAESGCASTRRSSVCNVPRTPVSSRNRYHHRHNITNTPRRNKSMSKVGVSHT